MEKKNFEVIALIIAILKDKLPEEEFSIERVESILTETLEHLKTWTISK